MIRGTALALVFFLFALTGTARGAQPMSNIDIGYATISGSTTILWVAQDEKFLQKNGIEANLVFMPGAPTLIAAINSGALAAGYTGATAALAAAANGADFRILGAAHANITHDLVVKPDIKEPKDLRNKRIGVTSIGGTGWMAGMLAFEQLGLNPDKDKMIISGFGDMRILSKALEANTVDGALVSGNYTANFKRAGFGTLGKLDQIPLVSAAVIVKHSFTQSQPDLARRFMRSLIEAQAFVMSPAKEQAVMKVLAKRLNITDRSVLEDTFQDFLRRIEKKPYASAEGVRNVQRYMLARNPKVAQVKVQELLDDANLRELDKSGYIDRVYTEYGVK
jgi:NitT/TauT family transport system substrate-binding protein